jgi:hypothetical protein
MLSKDLTDQGQRRTTSRTTCVPFLTGARYFVPFLYSAQTETGAHPASYPMGTGWGGGGKPTGSRAGHSLKLEPMPRMVEARLHFPTRFHSGVRNELSTGEFFSFYGTPNFLRLYRFPALPGKKSSGSGTGSTQPREYS